MTTEIATLVETSAPSPRRWNGRCARKTCRHPVSILGISVKNGKAKLVVTATGERYRRCDHQIAVPCVKCNADPSLRGRNGWGDDGPLPHMIVCTSVHGVVRPEIACSAKCLSATGHDCQCSCGGKNHGGAH